MVRKGFRAWHISIIYLFLILLFTGSALLTAHLNYFFPFVGYGGTFKWTHLSIAGVSVSLYWLSHLAGLMGMVIYCLRRGKYYEITAGQAVMTAILLAVLGYTGAKILYIIENWQYVLTNGISLNGVSFFGTVFFMLLMLPLLARFFGVKTADYMDYCTPAGLIMLICIRTGCFMNNCCHGITLWVMDRPVTLPAQLLECALDLLVLEAVFRMGQKEKYRGYLYLVFMGGYGIIRFFVEFIRETQKDILGLSHGQWFAAGCVMISAIAFLRQKSMNR